MSAVPRLGGYCPGMADSVVLASFENRRVAEHALGSLGRGFRKKARKGRTSALIVSANRDGSLRLTQSRVLTGGDLASAVIHVSAAIMLGFTGIRSSLKGARRGAHAAHVRSAHVGSDEHRAHEILAEAGPNAALVLIHSSDDEVAHDAGSRVADRARYSWHGQLPEFLDDLNPGAEHDWVRAALGETQPAPEAPPPDGAPTR